MKSDDPNDQEWTKANRFMLAMAIIVAIVDFVILVWGNK